MKHFSLFSLLFLTLALASCSRNDDGTDLKPETFTYTIDGVSDQTQKQYGSVNIPLSVRRLSGTAERVSLIVAGAPSDVTTNISPDSDTPSFTASMNINVGSNTKTGTYPMKVTGTSKSGIVIEKAFNLTVLDWNCARSFDNIRMNGSTTCSAIPGGNFQSLVTADPRTARITISNFCNLGNTVNVECNLNCDGNTISIPTWMHSSGAKTFRIQGDGTFTDNELNIRFYYSDISGETICTVKYTR